MPATTEMKFPGAKGEIVVHKWEDGDPLGIVVLVHGYGEHAGRYDHVAQALVESAGAVVYAPDLLGHGKSEGERVLVTDFADYVADVRALVKAAREEHPDKPLGLIGHSLGGIVATLYAQEYPEELNALVLSAPLIGGNPGFQQLLEMDPMPEVPIDPDLLSRDSSVGEAYAADELVWHGPFRRETLQAAFAAIEKVSAGPQLGSIPALWIHGEEDQLAPLGLTGDAVELVGGEQIDKTVYPGARHEIFNETNRDEVIADVIRFLQRSFDEAPGESDAPAPQDRVMEDPDAPQDRLAI